jgi:light-regulated signal transduction histidine kinase (bacteriophytochrome)
MNHLTGHHRTVTPITLHRRPDACADSSIPLAHDLRNCLYLVASFASLLRDGTAGAVTPEQSEFLENILTCARQGQALLAAPRTHAGDVT